jgi:hypothetical protein
MELSEVKWNSENNEKRFECLKCNKNYSNKSNLNKHLKKCDLKITYVCEYCNIILSEKECLKKHLLICRKYEYIQMFREEKRIFEAELIKKNEEKRNYEEEINKLKLELTILKEHNLELKEYNLELKKEKDEYFKLLSNNKKEKIINNNTTNNISIINITIDDLRANNLKIHDLMGYGNSIANYVLNSTEIQDKIKLRDKARKLIEYSIEDKKYNDKGRKLIIFIVKNYEDKIIKLLKDTYGKDLDEMAMFNEHLNRLKNIRDNELREIIIDERVDNQLGREIFETLLENLNKNSEIKYIIKKNE